MSSLQRVSKIQHLTNVNFCIKEAYNMSHAVLEFLETCLLC